jgi:glycosyltransferase involved in cell wall biosynthesis
MNILLISASDINGGAARAAYRLHKGLLNIGVSSNMLVQEKYSDDKKVLAPEVSLFQGIAKARATLDPLPLKFYQQRSKTPFSLQWLPDTIYSNVSKLSPDIINLHWIGRGFVQIETITRLNKPLVWTLHDMWAFTGGCHYSGECSNYTASCGACPQLNSTQKRDLSHWILQRKAKAWKNLNLIIVSPSNWLAECAKSSFLFKDLQIEVIPNGINTEKYRPINKYTAREILNLPQDKQIILFGSLRATSDLRKGFQFLQPALQNLSKSVGKDKLELLIFGASQPENEINFGFKANYLGSFNDDLSLALVYSAADVFILPSTQENLANTVMEAIACGTPCVAFKIGGTPDMIEHQKNGYLVQPYNIEDLAKGIAWVLENPERHSKLTYYAREKAEREFSLEVHARQYSKIYKQIIDYSNS